MKQKEDEDGIFILAVCSVFAYGFIYLLFLAPFSYEEKMTTSEIQKRQEIKEGGSTDGKDE